MKRNLLALCTLILTGFSFGQVIFSVETPLPIAGSYDLTYVEPPNWGSPDLLDPLNAIQDTLAFAKDATVADSLNCQSTVTNVDGKIAVLYRGACEFGVKALNAQNAGAVGVVIINNIPGAPVAMGAGVEGINVTIPVVMLGELEGQIITNAMNNGPVEAFIGNKTGFYPNDLGFLNRSVLRAPQYATPQALAQDDNDLSVDLGAWVYNYGFNDQNNVTVNATVVLNGTELYNETSPAQTILAGDSAYVALTPFSQVAYTQGKYELTYTTVSDSLDSYDFDNTFEADFRLTDSLLSYARLDDTNLLPLTAGGFRPTNSTDFTACIGFQNPNASRIGVRGLTFSAITGANSGVTLDGEPFEVQMFKWNDNFTDLNDANAAVSDFEYLTGNTDFFFTGDFQDSAMYVTVDEPFVLLDNQRYMFCIYTSNQDVFFGYDAGMDYTQNVNNYLEPLFPSITENGQFLNGFGADAVPGLSVATFPAAELGLEEEVEINISAFPNPAMDKLMISLNNNSASEFSMYDLSGKVVKSGAISGYDNLSVNVKDIENGAYIVKIALEDGRVKMLNVVVNH